MKLRTSLRHCPLGIVWIVSAYIINVLLFARLSGSSARDLPLPSLGVGFIAPPPCSYIGRQKSIIITRASWNMFQGSRLLRVGGKALDRKFYFRKKFEEKKRHSLRKKIRKFTTIHWKICSRLAVVNLQQNVVSFSTSP